jgi:hypothetical protein
MRNDTNRPLGFQCNYEFILKYSIYDPSCIED